MKKRTNHPLYDQLDRLAIDRWARTAVRIMLRVAWLSLSIWCLGYAAVLLWGWAPRRELLSTLALGLLLSGALLLLFRRRLSPMQVARGLDRRFRLNEQLSTALEVASNGRQPDGIAARLVTDSTRTAVLLRRRIEARARPPWVEVIALLALALMLLGFTILSDIDRNQSALLPLPLPGLLPPESAAEPPPNEQRAEEQQQPQPQAAAPQQSQAGAQQGGQSAAERLADALRDQAPTRSAAEALDQGNTAGAAAELRELADQAGDLSQRSREDLAEQLRDAASDLGAANPGLAQQLERSAQGLEQGGEAASQALDELARTVENLGGQGQGQAQGQQGQQNPGGSQGSGDGGQGGGQSAPSERLGVDGVPIELGGEGEGENITGNADSTGTRVMPQGREQGQPRQSPDVVQTGDDPLSIPADLRDVVQGYFSPED